jgi:hypothetical protein
MCVILSMSDTTFERIIISEFDLRCNSQYLSCVSIRQDKLLMIIRSSMYHRLSHTTENDRDN